MGFCPGSLLLCQWVKSYSTLPILLSSVNKVYVEVFDTLRLEFWDALALKWEFFFYWYEETFFFKCWLSMLFLFYDLLFHNFIFLLIPVSHNPWQKHFSICNLLFMILVSIPQVHINVFLISKTMQFTLLYSTLLPYGLAPDTQILAFPKFLKIQTESKSFRISVPWDYTIHL